MKLWLGLAVIGATVGCADGGGSSSEAPTSTPASAGAPPSAASLPTASAVTIPATAPPASAAPTAAPTPPPTDPTVPPTTDAVPTTTPTPAPTTTGPPVTKLAPTSTQFLFDEAGDPFFWLGDTAWALPFKLDRDEVVVYLDTRAAQGYNVIQTIASLDLEGWPGANRYGDEPFDGDVSRLAITPGADPIDADEYDFWDHLDFIVAEALARDMYVALVPIWGNSAQIGQAITTENAAAYGSFLSARYSNRGVIWMVGGDMPPDGFTPLWQELATGIATGATGVADYAATTMTYHPRGMQSSAEWFHDEPWLDFNMIQTGHCRNFDVRQNLINTTYRRTPPKPFIDGEPLYEAHPYCGDQPPDGIATDLDVRRDAYYSVFSGAAGHTYGHNTVYQFLHAGEPPRTGATGEWTTALHAPGGEQMRHLKALMLSRPFTTTVPDDSIILTGQGAETNRLVGTRAADGSYLMVYSPLGTPYTVNLDVLSGDVARLWWYNPRTGEATLLEERPSASTVVVTAMSSDDWVLVADDAARNFAAPGT